MRQLPIEKWWNDGSPFGFLQSPIGKTSATSEFIFDSVSFASAHASTIAPPKCRYRPAREMPSMCATVDLDAPYSAAVPGGWFLLLAQGNRALSTIAPPMVVP